MDEAGEWLPLTFRRVSEELKTFRNLDREKQAISRSVSESDIDLSFEFRFKSFNPVYNPNRNWKCRILPEAKPKSSNDDFPLYTIIKLRTFSSITESLRNKIRNSL
jgi:hypothetical protein